LASGSDALHIGAVRLVGNANLSGAMGAVVKTLLAVEHAYLLKSDPDYRDAVQTGRVIVTETPEAVCKSMFMAEFLKLRAEGRGLSSLMPRTAEIVEDLAETRPALPETDDGSRISWVG
jgi:hypothetical protein